MREREQISPKNGWMKDENSPEKGCLQRNIITAIKLAFRLLITKG